MSFCYSHDEENFHGDEPTREEALAEALADGPEPGDTVYTGRFEAVKLERLLRAAISPDYLLERLAEAAYGEMGDFAEDWLTEVKPSEKESLVRYLAGALEVWALAEGHLPKFFRVTDVESHVVPEVEA